MAVEVAVSAVSALTARAVVIAGPALAVRADLSRAGPDVRSVITFGPDVVDITHPSQCYECYLLAALSMASDPADWLAVNGPPSWFDQDQVPVGTSRGTADRSFIRLTATGARTHRLPAGDGCQRHELASGHQDSGLLDSACGPVGRPVVTTTAEGLWLVSAVAANRMLISPRPDLLHAGAIGHDLATTAATAVGEAVERYAMCYPVTRELIVNRARAGDGTVRPEWLIAPAGGRKAGPACSDPELWTWARNPRSGEQVAVPAALVHPRPGTATVELTTSGVAAAITAPGADPPTDHVSRMRRAADAALLELVERDAVMCWWLRRSPACRLPVSMLGPDDRALVARLGLLGWQAFLLAVPAVVNLPVAVAVLRAQDPRLYPHVAVGAACRRTWEQAAAKALQEACQVRHTASGNPGTPSGGVCRTSWDHMALAANAPIESLDWALDGAGSLPATPSPGPSDIWRAIGEATGWDPLVVDLTTSALASAGAAVARVLAFGLQPYYADETSRLLCPARLGAPTAGESESDGEASPQWLASLNPLPHPLA